MNHASCPETANSNSLTEFPRCQHRTRKGRCRELVSDIASGLCSNHAAQLKKERDATNVSARLIGDTKEFTSAVAINRSLGELYKLLARDEVAPRCAAVMAYTCNLLLHTLPAIERELRPKEQDSMIIWDIDSAVARRAAVAKAAGAQPLQDAQHLQSNPFAKHPHRD